MSSRASNAKSLGPITQGQRIFFTGHSFHVFVPAILADIAAAAGISGQKQIGLSSIGGSRVIQHWDVPDEKSLGNLYPRYVQDGKVFRCPSAEDQPSFALNLPIEYRGGVQTKTLVGALPQGGNWTLTGNQFHRASSYGYDPRISPRAAGRLVVAADLDGSYGLRNDTEIWNHDGGQNVLFVDGAARWIEAHQYYSDNFCSRDPNDNIFVEDKWDADTDSFLVDTDAALSVSFEGYEHLHFPQKAKP